MLACVGLWFPTAVGHVPVDWAAKVSANPLEAQFQLPNAVLGQLIVAIAIAEGLRARLVYSEGHVPGEHGFDPMGFIPNYCDTPEKCAPPRPRALGMGWGRLGHFRGPRRPALTPRPLLPLRMREMKLKELKHCRIAMIASIGMIAQLLVKGSIWPFIN